MRNIRRRSLANGHRWDLEFCEELFGVPSWGRARDKLRPPAALQSFSTHTSPQRLHPSALTRRPRSKGSSHPPSPDFLRLILPRLCVLLPPSSLPRYVAMLVVVPIPYLDAPHTAIHYEPASGWGLQCIFSCILIVPLSCDHG
jgi:hypothetical protein